jgi:ATP-binding cassette, subfamily B, multidrug efflux pump
MTPDQFVEDDKLTGTLDRGLVLRLLTFVRPYWKMIAVSSVISLTMALLQLAGPYIIKVTIDRDIANGDYAGIARMSALFVATLVAQFGLEYLQGVMISIVGQRAMFDLRAVLFDHVQKLSLAFFDRNPVGRIMTRITSDVAALNEMFSQGIMTLAGDIFLLIAIAGIMIWTNFTLAMLVFATAPLLIFAAWLFRRSVRASYREVRQAISRMNAYLQENLSGMRTVQAYNRQERNFDHFSGLNSAHRTANMKTVFAHALFIPAVELIGAISLALIVWYGGVASLGGTITLGTIYLFIQYGQRFFQPIKDLSDKFNIFQTAMASAERVFRLLDTQPQIVAKPDAVPCPPVEREVAFENVWFAYKGEEWVLRDVSFTVKRGQTIALVGPTGSGKTTVTNLIARFYDVQKGAIRIDGIDIRDMDPQSLRSRIAIVLQDVFLFTGTMSSNIRLGNTDITDDEIRRCASYVNANGFIERLPGAYGHEVRERGATLSVGQKQLLAFARALAFDPEILILDEATASIDTETELLIQDALRKLLRGRTSIVIAHRLSTIQNADRIIVLHHGKIRESGTHAELLHAGGLYRKLYELQYRNGVVAAPATQPSAVAK